MRSVSPTANHQPAPREGALHNLSPALGAGIGSGVNARPRRRPLQNLALLNHFVVGASAATKLDHIRFPRAKRGAEFVERAFARDRRFRASRSTAPAAQDDRHA